MSEWQEIESARKDGSKIDVWVREFLIGEAGQVTVKDVGRVPNAWWGESCFVVTGPYERRIGPEGWVHKSEYDPLSDTLVEGSTTRVTHWMPLPDPPSPHNMHEQQRDKPDEHEKG